MRLRERVIDLPKVTARKWPSWDLKLAVFFCFCLFFVVCFFFFTFLENFLIQGLMLDKLVGEILERLISVQFQGHFLFPGFELSGAEGSQSFVRLWPFLFFPPPVPSSLCLLASTYLCLSRSFSVFLSYFIFVSVISLSLCLSFIHSITHSFNISFFG